MITFISSAKFDKEASVVLLTSDQIKTKKFNFRNEAVKTYVVSVFGSDQFSAQNGELFPFVLNKRLILLVGLGAKAKFSLTALRITVRKALLSSFLKRIRDVEIVPSEDRDEDVRAVIEGAMIGTYRWRKYLSKDKDDKTIDDKRLTLVCAKNKDYEAAVSICEGVRLARDLVNENADIVTSDFLEKTIKQLTGKSKKVHLEILNRKELAAKGLHLHLAVNQGSTREPKLIIVRYQGGSPKDKYIALVGKGMTFDTGGLNLKPTGSIETMRCDMSGAAAVVGTLQNVLKLGIKRNIIFAIGLAENAIDARSYKPGDVLRSYNGKTVEIGNTDAEGRLVLADAISYLVRNYHPDQIVDIATLTGACVIALGYDYTGLVSNNDDLARKMIRASNETDDRVWRLPSYPEIKDYVKSDIADIKNIGLPKGALGTCTAAEFLRQFTEDTKWIHLDIAGTAFADKGRMYFGVGATGAGVRLLTRYLQD